MEVDVKLKSFGWVLPIVATIGGAWMSTGCGAYSVTATGGTTYRQSGTTPDPLSSALRESASRDLPCDNADLAVSRLEPQQEYLVAGCGRSVAYRAITPTVTSKRLELVTRSESAPGGAVALSPPSPARLR
jgi:hypothetical protein